MKKIDQENIRTKGITIVGFRVIGDELQATFKCEDSDTEMTVILGNAVEVANKIKKAKYTKVNQRHIVMSAHIKYYVGLSDLEDADIIITSKLAHTNFIVFGLNTKKLTFTVDKNPFDDEHEYVQASLHDITSRLFIVEKYLDTIIRKEEMKTT